MARVAILKPERGEDPQVDQIFEWVIEREGSVPNHFYVEMNFPELFKAKLATTQVLWEMGELTMAEVQHVGILVSRDNDCPYCTAAFCTIMNMALGTSDDYISELVENGLADGGDERLSAVLAFALKVNRDPKAITDDDTDGLRGHGLTDRGLVQLIHLVSDFGSYNRLNIALDTDYDYRELWQQAFDRAQARVSG